MKWWSSVLHSFTWLASWAKFHPNLKKSFRAWWTEAKALTTHQVKIAIWTATATTTSTAAATTTTTSSPWYPSTTAPVALQSIAPNTTRDTPRETEALGKEKPPTKPKVCFLVLKQSHKSKILILCRFNVLYLVYISGLNCYKTLLMIEEVLKSMKRKMLIKVCR